MRVISKITEIYPLFNEQDFIKLCESIFEKIQLAWMNNNLKELSLYETTDLFLEHRIDSEKLKQSRVKDVIKDITFEKTDIISFQQDDKKELEIIELEMKLSMINYYLDESTNQIIKGNDVKKRTAVYQLTFINEKGKLMEKKVITDIDTCPYCGAPIDYNISLTCDYCHRTISVDINKHVLKLSKLLLIEVI